MNKLYTLSTLILLTFLTFSLQAQNFEELPEYNLQKNEAEAHLRFIASDELQGRRTADPGSEVAARYIAEQYRSYGIKSIEGADEYFQIVPFKNSKPAESGSMEWGDSKFVSGNNLILLSGGAIDTAAQAVFANYGWIDEENGINDYDKLDVEGKIVIVLSGLSNTQDPYAIFNSMSVKQQFAEERGAIALIELYRLSFPWNFFYNYFSRERLEIADNTENKEAANFIYGWIKEEHGANATALSSGGNAIIKIKSSGAMTEMKPSKNVIGLIEGTDPSLKNEYILISAHYDHVGIGKQGGSMYSEQDSIFNGARDNGMGVVALLSAAKTLALVPPKRSIILLACTAEEMGLLGSKYYTEHPLIPLNKTVFNLNSDGAGYDDIEAISIVGYDRVGVVDEFEKAAKAFGLRVIADPAPEQNLFDRSDNVNFAARGIPAPSVSPGTTGFTEEIGKYYHQAIDNPETIDYNYLLTFCKAFSYIARLIADKDHAPRWAPGDKYEEAGKRLYGK